MDEHYLKTVASLGDSRKVITNQAIFATNGIKLVDQGVRFNSSFFDRLVRHKLMPPLEQCLDVEDGVTRDFLRDYAQELLKNDASPCCVAFRTDSEISDKILGAVHKITLIPPLAFKLTVARDRHSEIFDHSMRIVIISLYIAIKMGLSAHDQVIVATAALFHDLGLLHVDPALMVPGRTLAKQERHHLYSHPITAFLILREYPEYHPEISTPVYEHHERLDGSGYPSGLKENEISLSSQILIMAEIACSFIASEQWHRVTHLPVMLKLNQQKINKQVSNHLITLVSDILPGSAEAKPANTIAEIESKRKVLSDLFRDWSDTITLCKGNPNSSNQLALLDLIDSRFQDLFRNLLSTGMPRYSQAPTLDDYKDDAKVIEEIEFTVHEALWQVTDITHEARRRSQQLDREGTGTPPEIKHWLMRSEMMLEMS